MSKQNKVTNTAIIRNVKLIKATHSGNKVWNNRTRRYEVDNENIVTALTLAELKEEDYTSIKSAYEGVANNFIPKWYTDAEGFMNLKSWYQIPVMDINGATYEDITELIESNPCLIGSTVDIAVDIKKGSIYPRSIKIIEYGEERNPFEGM